ncbi:diaminopimelate epimerase [Candidatus Albibeggiatoa sp. nov. NOAA]|uniref:diaminopimelate epimerase n=1 Tax=Candidatus Albibeggiatoa sp. nov. NOAA TaxID=3162724 RepID=UPI0032F273B6|nr:diaminopimelate epimerase [Thiotrichaceae bacterium]
MHIQFSKMHGLGNDFIVIDAINQQIDFTLEQVQQLSHRHFGIGCDQLLLVEKSEQADFRYRIFNADGGEVAQCGNGARCFAKFVKDKGLTDKTQISVETASGIIYPQIEADGNITVDMGKPRFEPNDIPFLADERSTTYLLDVDGVAYPVGAVSMGNPHAVVQVQDIEIAPVAEIGAKIESHPQFPERVNVGFMQVCNKNEIKLRVFERGVGETMACGTGACAAVVIGQMWQQLDAGVTAHLTGGDLRIHWTANEQDSVMMTGAAIHVFEGTIQL